MGTRFTETVLKCDHGRTGKCAACETLRRQRLADNPKGEKVPPGLTYDSERQDWSGGQQTELEQLRAENERLKADIVDVYARAERIEKENERLKGLLKLAHLPLGE